MYVKKYNIFKKTLALLEIPMYTTNCCGMIAVKREVAVSQQWRTGFPWSECQVRKLTTSHCTDLWSVLGQKRRESSKQVLPRCEISWRELCEGLGHTRESVQSPLVVLRT